MPRFEPRDRDTLPPPHPSTCGGISILLYQHTMIELQWHGVKGCSGVIRLVRIASDDPVHVPDKDCFMLYADTNGGSENVNGFSVMVADLGAGQQAREMMIRRSWSPSNWLRWAGSASRLK